MPRMANGAARPAAMRCRAMAKSMSATSPAAIRTSSACRSPRPATCSRARVSPCLSSGSSAASGRPASSLVEDGAIVEARILREGVVPAGTILQRAAGSRPGAHRRRTGRRRGISAAQGGARRHRRRDADDRSDSRGAGRRRALEASAGAGARRDPAASRRRVGLTCRFQRRRDALDAVGWVGPARRSAQRHHRLPRRRAARVADPGDDPDRRRWHTCRPSELALAGATAAARDDPPPRDRRIDRHRPARRSAARRRARRSPRRSTPILPQPFERTAVNGFGFLQIVRPRRHASLFELAADRAAFEARALLRRAARETGAIALVAHPAVACRDQRPEWIDAARRARSAARSPCVPTPSLAMSAAHAQPPLRNARCAASPPRPTTRRSAAAAARTATCCKWLGDGYRDPRPAGRQRRAGQRRRATVRERLASRAVRPLAGPGSSVGRACD